MSLCGGRDEKVGNGEVLLSTSQFDQGGGMQIVHFVLPSACRSAAENSTPDITRNCKHGFDLIAQAPSITHPQFASMTWPHSWPLAVASSTDFRQKRQKRYKLEPIQNYKAAAT